MPLGAKGAFQSSMDRLEAWARPYPAARKKRRPAEFRATGKLRRGMGPKVAYAWKGDPATHWGRDLCHRGQEPGACLPGRKVDHGGGYRRGMGGIGFRYYFFPESRA